MGTTTNFDLTQTAFLFSLVSNSSSAEKGTAQQLADYTYCALTGDNTKNPFTNLIPPGLLKTFGSQLIGGDWGLVWGPGVFEISPSAKGKSDNTAYVVYSPSKNTYIVAIAGTDPAALKDWLVEDFEVGPKDCVDWSTYSPTGDAPVGGPAALSTPQISLGTAFGVWALASQLTLSTYAPVANTLAAFLQGLTPTAGCQILFTGHSLGGALSPTLAYWAKGLSNLSGATILALPTAGPTPGNQPYQAAWDSAFPPAAVANPNSGNQVTQLNRDVWHAQDVVPHAWQYIYTPNVQDASSTPVATQYYFSDPSFNLGHLVSLIGDLYPGTVIHDVARGRQNAGTAAGMTRSATTLPFLPVWPMQYVAKDGSVESLAQPSGPHVPPYAEFFDALALIHTQGYGVTAFGLDISVFVGLHTTSVSKVH